MVFSSVTFLCLFLPIFLIAYFISKNITFKNIVLVAFSLVFYAWGEPVWVLALLTSGLTDYFCGCAIEKSAQSGKTGAGKKIALAVSLIINLGILTTFKYSGFIIENINAAARVNLPVPRFNLPLGISFYTFQTMSYTIDTYRGKIKAQKSLLSFLCYVTMFPQLVAGPIVRYSDIEGDLTDRKMTRERLSAGITRFAIGLVKKTLLANPAGAAATALLADASRLTTASAWLGIALFIFQVYFDFSGYSDMAIGIGKMIGFDFLENFNYPLESSSVTDFWRRWHISLGSFFRDYVYIPLGGNKKNQVRNIAIVWLLTGFWHGASWNYIFWGLYQGVFLMLERYALRGALAKAPSLIRRIYAIPVVLFGFGLFYFTSIPDLGMFIKAMFHIGVPLTSFLPGTVLANNFWLIIILVVASTSWPKKAVSYLSEIFPGVVHLTEPIFTVACTLASFVMLLGQTYNPFLYFRF